MRVSLFRYILSTAGAVAILFGLSVPMIVGGVGLSVDVARSFLVKERLSQALDAAALAGASSSSKESEIRSEVEKFMDVNYPSFRLGDVRDLDVEVNDNTVTVAAYADLDTSFMKIFGKDSVTVHASSTIQRVNRINIELSMTLDLSASMTGSKITDLKAAAADMVDIIVQDNQNEVFSKIALVPYAVAVNVGTYANSVRGTYTSGTCTSPGCDYYKFNNPSNQSKTHRISTCVTERTGTNAYTDVAPNTTANRVGRNYPSTANTCLTSKIVPLTSNKTTLKTAINGLAAAGSTGGQVGVGWGWYMLSPNWGYLWPNAENKPAAYGTEDLVKILVLMTDGEYNSPYCNGVIAKDATTGSGATTDHINCNATNGNAYTQSEKMCAAMKKEGVIVYTIGFDIVDSQPARDLMSKCATDAQHAYLAANGDELKQVFRDIAGDVMSVYISK